MSTVRTRIRVACFVAMALLCQFAPAVAGGRDDRNRPVELTFGKWFIASTLMEGRWGGNPDNRFVGELLRRQASVNPAVNAIALLEAVYEFHHGDEFFTALIRGGSNSVTGAAQLDGVILAGWRTGASVHVEFDRILGHPVLSAAPVRQRAPPASSGRFALDGPHGTEHAARPQASSRHYSFGNNDGQFKKTVMGGDTLWSGATSRKR